MLVLGLAWRSSSPGKGLRPGQVGLAWVKEKAGWRGRAAQLRLAATVVISLPAWLDCIKRQDMDSSRGRCGCAILGPMQRSLAYSPRRPGELNGVLRQGAEGRFHETS
jgi:hypothetical protein